MHKLRVPLSKVKVTIEGHISNLNPNLHFLDHHLPDGGLIKSVFVRRPSVIPSVNNSCYCIYSETTGWILTKLGQNDPPVA